VRDHLVEEVGRVEPLALQPALHVHQGEHHGVDLALGDGDPQLFQRERSFPHRRASITKVYWLTG
jgi:hypothetical protein